MVHKKYIKVNGKLYGPYNYENKRVGQKVITTYIGRTKEDFNSKGTDWRRLLTFILITVVLLGAVYFISLSQTGRVSLELQTSYQPGETISGQMSFNLQKGELIPAGSELIVKLGSQEKTFSLNELVSVETTSGEFYASGANLEGSGEGYGVIGSKTSYPTVEFELLVSGGAEEPETEQPTEEPSAPETPEENITAEENITIPAEEDATTPENETITEENTSETPEEEPTNESSDKSGDEFSITGAVVSGEPDIISGSVSAEGSYEYNIGEGESVSLVEGSVKVNGEMIGDDSIILAIENGKAVVTTGYSLTEEGFGADFVGENALELDIDVGEFGIDAENGEFEVRLVHGDSVIISGSEQITIEEGGNESIPEETANLSLIMNIPTIRMAEGTSATITLSNYFAGAESYALAYEIEDIAGTISGDKITLTPDKKFIGTRTAKVTAYSGGEESVESNEFSIVVGESRLNIQGVGGIAINFTNPTPADGIITTSKTATINVSMSNAADLSEMKWNWNGTNYTMYNDSLVLMYNFDKISELGESEANITDLSRYGNNGTAPDYSWTGGQVDGGLHFDGIDDYVSISDDNSLDFGNDSFSASLWIKTSKTGGIIGKRAETGAKDQGFALGLLSSGKIYFLTEQTTTDSSTIYGITNLSDNSWHNIVIVRSSGGAHSLYVDNALENSTSLTVRNITTSTNLLIGGTGNGNTPSSYFNGTFDEVRIWNRTLSADEIANIYTNESAEQADANMNRTGLVLEYNLNETYGKSATDTSGSGNTGTLTGYAVPTFNPSGKYGGAYEFDGVDDYLNITNKITFDDYTMAVWVKDNIGQNGYRGIVAFSDAGAPYNIVQFTRYDDATILFNPKYVNPGCTTGYYYGFGERETWYQLAMKVSGTTATYYVNGQQVGTDTTCDQALTPATGRIGRGSPSYYNAYYFNGSIDEVRIWNRSLSAAEIQQQYYSSLNKYSNSEWQFYSAPTNLDGTYTYQAFAKDALGNNNGTETRNFTSFVNVSFVWPPNNAYSASKTVSFNCSINDGNQVSSLELFAWNSSNYNLPDLALYSLQWNKTWGGASTDYGQGITVYPYNNNIYAAGYTNSFGNNYQFALVKYDKDGTYLWNRTIGGTNIDYGYDVALDSNENAYVAGRTASFGAGGYDVWLVKFDKDGNHLWNKTYGGTGQDHGWAMSMDPEENIYMVAESQFGPGTVGYWVLKTDSNGNHLWNVSWGGAGNDAPYDVYADSDAVYVTGMSNSFISAGGAYDILTVKFDSNGNYLWNDTIKNPGTDRGGAITTDLDGNVFVAGYKNISGSTNNDVWVLKYNSSGALLWNRLIGGSGNDASLGGIVTDFRGNVYVGAYTASFGAGANDFWLLKYDRDGNYLWNQTLGSSSNDAIYQMYRDYRGNLLVEGATAFGAGGLDFWTTKYSSNYMDELSGTSNATDISYTFASDGIYTWNCLGTDNLSYSGWADENRTITIDTIKPTIRFVLPTEISGTIVGRNNLRIYVNASDINLANLTIRLYDSNKNLVNETQTNSATNYVNIKGLSNGIYFFNATALDFAGNMNNTETRNVTIDLVAPNITLTSPENAISSPTKNVTFNCNITDNIQASRVQVSIWDSNESSITDFPSIRWNKTVGVSSSDYAYQNGIAVDSNRNVYTTGAYGATSSPPGIIVIKYDSNGNPLWNKTADLTGADYGHAVAVDDIGDAYVVATTNVAGNEDMWVLKYNSSGTLLWNRTIGGSAGESGDGIALDSAENVYVAGKTNSFGAGGYDSWLVKYDSNGNYQWNKTYGGVYTEYWNGITIDTEDNIYTVGYYSGVGTSDIKFGKYDVDGNNAWVNTASAGTSDNGYGITTDSSGNIYLAGVTNSAGSNDGWLVKYDGDGNSIWNKIITGSTSTNDILYSVKADREYNIYTTGYGNISDGSRDIWMLKYDGDGNQLWNFTVGGSNEDMGKGIALDYAGDIYILAQTKSFGVGNEEMWVLKYSKNLTRDVSGQNNITLFNYTFGSDGDYSWNCIGFDRAGNLAWSGEANRTMTIDIPPNGTILSPTNGTINTTSQQQNFTINLSDETGLANATLFLFNASGLYNQTTVYLYGATQATVGILITLVDGVYHWFWEVVDLANNIFETQTEVGNYTLTQDTLYPGINFTNPTPDNGSITSGTSAVINVSIDNAADLNSVLFNWNNINYTMYNDSLVLMYNFDNVSAIGDSGTKAVDVSKYNNNGTCTNMGTSCNYTAGVYGKGMYFDGVNDYIQAPDADALSVGNGAADEPFSMEFWVNVTNIVSPYRYFTKGSAGSNEWALYSYSTNYGDVALILYDNSTGGYRGRRCGSGCLSVGQWYHVVVTYNGNEANPSAGINIYRNGVAVDTADVNAGTYVASENLNNPLQIGSYWGTTQNLTGRMDEIKVWKKELSASEVQQNYISNLNKYDVDKWQFYANESGLSQGYYNYQAFAKDNVGNLNSTEIRTLLQGDWAAPGINFTNPTPDDGTNTTSLSAVINVSIDSAADLSSVLFNWNGTNYTMYNDSLLVMYNFDNVGALGEGANKAVDVSKQGNNGTITASTWTSSGKYGGAYSFNGLTDYVTLASPFTSNATGTISMWVYKKGNAATVGTLFDLDRDVAGGLRTWEAAGYWGFLTNAQSEGLTYSPGPSLNQWYYFAVTWNGTTKKIFLDGVEKNSSASTYFAKSSNAPKIAALWNNAATSYRFNGTIDEFRVWNRSLSADEIEQQYISNLNKYAADGWKFYANESWTEPVGTYPFSYTAYASDNLGNLNSTETRVLNAQGIAPGINFTNPTPGNGTITANTFAEINVSIDNAADLNSVLFNWNGTNYTMYNDSLVLMYNFDNVSAIGDSGTKAVDVSGKANNGTCINMGTVCNYTTGKYGKGIIFDGVNDYINLSRNIRQTSGTITFWIKTGTVKAAGYAFGHQNGNPSMAGYVGSVYNYSWWIRNSTGSTVALISKSKVYDNQWHHIVNVWGSGGMYLYVDGVLENSNSSFTAYDDASTANTIIGGINYVGTPDYFLDMNLDEFRIWNRSLSAAEVQQQYYSNLNKYAVDKWAFYANESNLSDGSYAYQAFAKDNVGNLNLTEQRTLTIDIGLPNGTILYPENGTTISVGKQNFTINLSDETGLANATLFLFNASGLYNQTTVYLYGATQATVGILITLVDGVYHWFWEVVDLANNIFETQTEVGNYTITTTNNISSGGELNIPGETYYLNQSVNCTGTCFTITADDVTLDCSGHKIVYGNVSGGTYYGVYAFNLSGIIIKNCEITDGEVASGTRTGIYFYGSSNGRIENVISSNNNGDGILLNQIGVSSYPNNNTIINNILDSNNAYGIHITFASNNIIVNNTARGDDVGFFAYGNSNYNVFENNTASGSTQFGIHIESSMYDNITGNNMSSNSYGLYIRTGDSNNIIGNEFNYNTYYGIYAEAGIAEDSINNNIIGNDISNNQNYGIYIGNRANSNNYINNTINSNAYEGIRFGFSTSGSNTFIGNLISNNSQYGIRIISAANNLFNRTTIANQSNWMYFENSNNNIFENTTFASTNSSVIFPYFNASGTYNVSTSTFALSYNKVFLNSTNLTFMNTSAEIKLTSLNFNNPHATYDPEDDGSYVRCPDEICHKIDYSSGTLVFNVTHFTGYSGEDSIGGFSSEGNLSEWRMFMRWLNHTAYDGVPYSVAPGINLTTYIPWGYPETAPAIANGYVYFGADTVYDAHLYQLNASNVSQLIGRYDDVAFGAAIYSSPAIVNGYLYIHSARLGICQFNATNITQPIATFNSGYGATASQAIADGYVYTKGSSINFYQLNASNVSQVINIFEAQHEISSEAPAVAGDYVYMGAGDYFYQMNASNVSQLVTILNYSGANNFYTPTVADGYVYAGSRLGFHQMNASNVSQLISFLSVPERQVDPITNITGGVYSAPAVADGYVYVGTETGIVYQMNASNISQLVANYTALPKVIRSAPTVAGEYVYVGSFDGNMYQLNASNVSQLIAKINTGTNRFVRSAAYAEGYIYFGSGNGKFYQVNASNISIQGEYDENALAGCDDLAISRTIYTLANNVTTNGTCMRIIGENITLDCAGNSIVYGNLSSATTYYGVHASKNGTKIINCDISKGELATASQTRYGIYFDRVERGSITNSNLNPNRYGIYINYGKNNLLENNTLYNNSYYALSLYYGTNNSVIDNNISITTYGIYNYYTNNNTIESNSISNCTNYGIFLYASGSNNISNNILASAGPTGINIGSSNYNVVDNNTIVGSTANGVYITPASSLSNNITNNFVYGGSTGINIAGQNTSAINNYVIKNYVGIGISVAYNDVINNTIINSTNYGIQISASWNNISGNTQRTAASGIYISVSTRNNSISNNDIRNNSNAGIYSNGGDELYVINNTVEGNKIGIYMFSADSNVSGNTISNNSQYGISIYSALVEITDNILIDNAYGISAQIVANSSFRGNRISGGTRGFDTLTSFNNNLFYNNSISSANYSIYETGATNTKNNTFASNTFYNNSLMHIDGINTSFYDTTFLEDYGSAYFGSFNISSGSIDITNRRFSLNNKSMYLNSTYLSFMNVSATITFSEVTFTNPVIFADFDDGQKRACPAEICQINSYDSGIISFNVSHFTNYSVGAAPNGTILAPQNGTTNETIEQNFTINLTDEIGLQNATLFIYNESGLYNQTTVTLGGVTQAMVGIVVTLVNGVYNWFWEVYNTAGNLFSTQEDVGNYTITILTDIYPPNIEFVAPTPENNSNSSRAIINISIYDAADLNEVKFNWNGTNYTIYNDLLILRLNFDNVSAIGESETKLVDISRYSNNASRTAAYGYPWTTEGVIGNGIQFTTQYDFIEYITVGASDADLAFLFNWTWMGWVNLSAAPSGTTKEALYSHGATFAARDKAEIWINATNWGLEYSSNNSDTPLIFFLNGDKLNAGQLYHLAVVRQDNYTAYYVNGVLNKSGTNDWGNGYQYMNNYGVQKLRVGYGAGYTAGRNYNGMMDEVKFWNRTLTDTEIANIYGNESSGQNEEGMDRTGLTLEYHMNESSGETADDTSDSNHDGVLFAWNKGGNLVSGKFGSAYQLDGKEDYFTISTLARNTTPVQSNTLSAWINPQGETYQGFGSTYGGILGYSNTGSGGPQSTIRTYNRTNDKVLCEGRFGTGTGTAISTSAVSTPIDTWNYVTCVYDYNGSLMNVSLYLNGVYNNSAYNESVYNYTNTATAVYIGNERLAYNEFYNGIIDEPQIWNRSLTAGEIKQQFDSNLNKYAADKWLLYVNESNLSNAAYFYQGFAKDILGNENSTEIRYLNVDITLPNGTILNPENGTETYTAEQNFTINLTDEIGLQNVTLFLFNESGLFNQTTVSLGGATNAVVGILITLVDGVYHWFWEVYDLAGNLFSTQEDVGNYTITKLNPGAITSCGELNGANLVYTLTSNVTSNGTCFTVTAENITLDGNGFTINYSASGTLGYGVYSTANYTTIKNTVIKEGTATGLAHGIYLYYSNSGLIQNNSILTTGGSAYGIYLHFSSNHNVNNNTINTTAASGGGSAHGILLTSSDNDSLNNNYIETRGAGSVGIYSISSSFNTLTNNQINLSNAISFTFTGTSIDNYNHSIDATNLIKGRPVNYTFDAQSIAISNEYSFGEIMCAWCNNVTYSNVSVPNIYFYYTNNSIVQNSSINNSNYGYPISLQSSHSNIIINNSVRSLYGVLLTSSNLNNLLDNNILTRETNGHGIYLSSGSNNNMTNNLINTTAVGGGGVSSGVYLYVNSINNNVRDNRIETAGGTNSHGVWIIAGNNNIRNNTLLIKATAAATTSKGIYLSASNNNLTDNVISTASANGHGIYITSGSNNTISGGRLDVNTTGIAIYSNSHGNLFSSMIINGSATDAIVLDSGRNNNFTNLTITNTARYDLNISGGAAANGTYIIDTILANYTIANPGSLIYFKDTGEGEIRFLQAVNGTGTNLSADVAIGNNSAYVNSDSQSGFNKSANITLYGLPPGFTEPIIKRDGAECPAGVCYNFTSLNAGTVVFNVSAWTTYSIGESNSAPNTPNVTINSTDGSNKTLQDLNCFANITDPDANSLNVTVEWIKDNVINLTIDYNDSYASGEIFNAILGSGNTTKGDTWSCALRLFDGALSTEFANSTGNVTIVNSAPNVTLLNPEEDNITTDRTPLFVWNGTDDDGDSMTYDINITAHPIGSDDNRFVTGLTDENYTPTTELKYLADNGIYYRWSVRANDGTAYSSFAVYRNINISALLTISLPVNAVEFGQIIPGQYNDTSANSPPPFVIRNDGNCMMNITIYSTALWASIAQPNNYYKFKADNRTGHEGAFNWLASVTNFTQMPLLEMLAIAELNHTEKNSSEIDIFVQGPPEELAGGRNSTVTFTSSLAE